MDKILSTCGEYEIEGIVGDLNIIESSATDSIVKNFYENGNAILTDSGEKIKSEKGDGKEQLKEEIMDCLKEKNDKIKLKFKPEIVLDDATREAFRELRKIYGNGHRSRPSDSVPQHFIPDL